MLQFPTFLFAPSSLACRLTGAAASGGRAMAGNEQFGEFSGGGLWRITFGEADLWERDQFMFWRALESALENGAAPCIVPLGDRRHQPLISPPTSQAFDDRALWDDAPSYTPTEVISATTADAALRATSISFDIAAPLPLIGGEFVSILHPTLGWRLYHAVRITPGGAEIRPPLREATPSGADLNWESPRCICRLEGDPGGVLEMLKYGKGGPISFVESFPDLA